MVAFDVRERDNEYSRDRLVRIIQEEMLRGRILAPQSVSAQAIYAGGTNLCPNSDFSFSQLAATTANTDPADAAATNQDCYRIFRQKVGDPISATHLRAASTETGGAHVPVWNKTKGVAMIGAVGGSDNYDIAFQLTQNWIRAGARYYVRVAVATADDTPLPEGTKLFAQLWAKRSGGAEGVIDGNQFSVNYRVRGLPGTQHLKYIVVAYTDSGVPVISQELDVPDAPDSLSQDDYIELTYAAAAGYIEFEVYRKKVATGEVAQIARDRNSSQLIAYDQGQAGRPEPGGFPSVTEDRFRAYATVLLDAVSIETQKTFNNLGLLVPSSFDASTLIREGTFLRIGLVGAAAINHQVYLDTVWLGESFNVWSPSPFDDYPSRPSTLETTGVPTSGGGTDDRPPIGGGSSCLWALHDMRMGDGSWEKLWDVDPSLGHEIFSGHHGEPNGILSNQICDVDQYFELEFDCGLKLLATPTHRFVRSLEDNSGVTVKGMRVGQKILGGRWDELCDLTLTSIRLVVDRPIKVCKIRNRDGARNKLYAVGDRETGWYAVNHNIKEGPNF